MYLVLCVCENKVENLEIRAGPGFDSWPEHCASYILVFYSFGYALSLARVVKQECSLCYYALAALLVLMVKQKLKGLETDRYVT